ncbi:MAG: YDG domain-containing protein, partial [Candidatus Omnitrophota bacterium]
VFSNKNVGAGKTVTLANTFSGADRDNYAITDQLTTTADITAKALTISGVTASNKVYDATTVANLNTASAALVGVVGSEDVSLNSTNKLGVFSDKNVGTGKTVTASGFALSGGDISNYTISQPAGLTANITVRTLTLDATGVDRVYDGTTDAQLTFSDDRVAGDVLTPSATSASFRDKYVGAAKTVNVTGLSISGADAANYVLSSTTDTTLADITAIVTGAISGIGGGVSVALSLNGGTPVTTTTNANGSFTFGGDLFVNAGDSMMIYVNNWAYQANLAGKVLEPVNVTGLNLANGQVSIGSASAVNIASSYTNADLATAKGTLSDHLYYSVPSNALAVNGADLFVPAGVNFTPGGNVTAAGDLNVAGTYTQDSNLAVTGDFALATGGTFLDASPLSHTFSVGGNFSVPFAIAGFRRYTGAGTAPDPFIIRNIYDLQAVKSNLTSHFKLYSSLDAASVASWNNNTGFDPIGDRDNLFTGSLNGNGKVISNLEVDRAGSDYLGLFGNIGSTGSVSNLALEDISIYGHDYVGGLTGLNAGSLSNVYTTGVQTVSGTNFVGGLAGGNTGSVANAYSSARVIGTNKVGGLVGENSGSGTIQKTYAMGYVTGTSNNVGGLVGANTSSAASSVSNSFWNMSSTGQAARNNVTEGSGISVTDTTNAMMSQGTYAGWDFQSTWVMDNSGTYPHFQFRYPEGVRGVSGVVYVNSTVGAITTEARAGAGKEVSVSYSPNTTGNGVYLDTTATGANSSYYLVLGKNAVGSSDYVIGTSLNGSTRMLASSGSVYPLNIWASETHTLVRAALPNIAPIVNPADGGNNGVNSTLIITTPTITPNIGTPTPTVTIVDQTPIGQELSADLQSLMGGIPTTPATNPIVITTEPGTSPDSDASTETSDTLDVAETIDDGDISFTETSPTGREPVPVKTDDDSAAGSGSSSEGTGGAKTTSEEGGEDKSAASTDDKKEVQWRDVPLTGFSGAEDPKRFLTDVRVLEGTVYVLDGANMMSLLGRGESLRILLKGKPASEHKTQPTTPSQATTSQNEESKSLSSVEADAQKKIAPNLPSEKSHDLRLFVKADSQSSIDALTQALQEKNSETYHVNVLRGVVGSIRENDVKLAVLSKASIIGLRVEAEPRAQVLAETEGVVIRLYSSIAEAVEDIGKGMEGTLETESQKLDESNLLPVETKAAEVAEKKVTPESKPAVKNSALDMAVAAVTKAFAKPKLVLTPEQTASPMTEAGMKVATPVVMERMENGMRYGTLRNPGKDVFVKGKGGKWMPAQDGM